MIPRLMVFCLSRGRGAYSRWPLLLNFIIGFALFVAITGCQAGKEQPEFKDFPAKTSSLHRTNQPAPVHSESIVLREGDTVRITFLGAQNLNTTQTIRRDGKIDLYLVGEVSAAGITPAELEKELKKRYKDQIVVNEITVAVESDSFTVYVTGSVMHAQKVQSNRPITVLEAIMEAGGPDYAKANLKAVSVLRQESGSVKKTILNLRDVMSGKVNQQ